MSGDGTKQLFAAIPFSLVDDLEDRKITNSMFCVMCLLYRWASFQTGRIRHTSAKAIAEAGDMKFRTVQDSLLRLDKQGYIQRHMSLGNHNWYPVTINNFMASVERPKMGPDGKPCIGADGMMESVRSIEMINASETFTWDGVSRGSPCGVRAEDRTEAVRKPCRSRANTTGMNEKSGKSRSNGTNGTTAREAEGLKGQPPTSLKAEQPKRGAEKPKPKSSRANEAPPLYAKYESECPVCEKTIRAEERITLFLKNGNDNGSDLYAHWACMQDEDSHPSPEFPPAPGAPPCIGPVQGYNYTDDANEIVDTPEDELPGWQRYQRRGQVLDAADPRPGDIMVYGTETQDYVILDMRDGNIKRIKCVETGAEFDSNITPPFERWKIRRADAAVPQ